MKGKKLKVYCLEILSLKDLYIRGRLNQLIAATIDMKSRFNDLTREDYSRLSKEYIQNSVAEFFKFRKKLLDFDPGAYEDTLDIIINTEYSDFDDAYFCEAMEEFFGSKHTIGFVSAYNDFADDFNALIAEFLVVR